MSMSRTDVKAYFDEATYTISYLVRDPNGSSAAIVDSVLDYDPASGRTSTESADRILADVTEGGLQVELVLETHVHADHLTAAPYLREKTGAKVGIGANITTVQETFAGIFHAESGFRRDGSQFELLLRDGDSFQVGGLQGQVMHTPGHTPNCMVYVIGDADFVGDTLFALGCGRMFEGTAPMMWESLQKLMALPAETVVYCGHEYTQANAKFALSVEPNNEELIERAREIDDLRSLVRERKMGQSQSLAVYAQGRDAPLTPASVLDERLALTAALLAGHRPGYVLSVGFAAALTDNLGLAISHQFPPRRFDRFFPLLVEESDQGATDLNGDGDADDRVLVLVSTNG